MGEGFGGDVGEDGGAEAKLCVAVDELVELLEGGVAVAATVGESACELADTAVEVGARQKADLAEASGVVGLDVIHEVEADFGVALEVAEDEVDVGVCAELVEDTGPAGGQKDLMS